MDMGSANEKLSKLAAELLPVYTEQLDTLWQYSQLQDKATVDLEKITPGFDRKEFIELEELNEIAALTTISLSDILIIATGLTGAKTTWEKIYFIKQGYLTLFETVKSYRNTNQKKLEILIRDQYSDLFPEFASIREQVNDLAARYKFEPDIRLMRNTIAGHVEKFKDYYQMASTLDGELLGQALTEFIPILHALQLLLYRVIKKSNEQIAHRWKEVEEKMKEITAFLNTHTTVSR